MRWSGRVVLAGAGIYLIASIALAWITLPTGQHAADNTPASERIYLATGPIHTDLVVPLTPATRARFDWVLGLGVPIDHPQATALVIGWGAREFYTATGAYSDLAIGPVWRAIAGDASVLRFDVIAGDPSDHGFRPLQLTPNQLSRLFAKIEDTLLKGSQTVPLSHPGHTATDVFLPAKGRFNLFQTCNTWIGQVLRKSGVAFGIWTPAPYSIVISHWAAHAQTNP
ncbi:DUF2459 domain-containing protein [Roseobacteraceae bacterium S113]